MSDTLQLGQHPDADQLSAFAEQCLPAHERERTLAHLAHCADCREIVALSLPPFQEFPVPAPEPVLTPWVGGWFSGWRLAWLAAPALAVLVALTIYLKPVPAGHRRAAEQADLAALHSPAPQPPQPLTGALTATKTPARAASVVGAAKALGPAPPGTRSSALPGDMSGDVSVPVNGRNFGFLGVPATPPQPVGGPVVVNGMPGGAAGGVAFGNGNGVGLGAGTGHGASAPPQQLSSVVPSASLPALTLVPAAHSSATVEVQAATAITAPATAAAPAGAISTLAKGRSVSTLAPLPSGLPIESFAADLHRRVALDTQHALFYSDDDDQRWKPVSPPWPGRAVAVAMMPTAIPHPAIISAGVMSRFAGAPASSKAATQSFDRPSIQPSAQLDAAGGSLSGTVTDTTGAAISGAIIVIRGPSAVAKSVKTAKTDPAGRYVFANLPPGSYRIEASAPGFEKLSLAQQVAPSAPSVANLKLAVGQASETVSVSASNAQIAIEPQPAVVPSSAAMIVAAPAPIAAAPVFVVLTDTGERWTSADGQSWQREPAKRQ